MTYAIFDMQRSFERECYEYCEAKQSRDYFVRLMRRQYELTPKQADDLADKLNEQIARLTPKQYDEWKANRE